VAITVDMGEQGSGHGGLSEVVGHSVVAIGVMAVTVGMGESLCTQGNGMLVHPHCHQVLGCRWAGGGSWLFLWVLQWGSRVVVVVAGALLFPFFFGSFWMGCGWGQ
jgi:hypothetical protein